MSWMQSEKLTPFGFNAAGRVLVPRGTPLTKRLGTICCELTLTVGCPPGVATQDVAGVAPVAVPVGAVVCASATRDATLSAVTDATTRPIRIQRYMRPIPSA